MEIFIIFLFGLVIGSFLLVLIERLPKEKPVFLSRSECDYCKYVLSPLDLIPVFSFIFLKGRCRYCQKKLSIKYPMMELFLGFSFLVLYVITTSGFISYPLIFGSYIFLFIFLAIVYSTLVVIFFTDFFDGIIPLYVVLIGIIVTICYLLLSSPTEAVSHLLTGVFTGLFFLAIFFITKMRGIGFGDVIYGFYMGLFLGFPYIIIGLYIAFLTGAFISIILVLRRKKKLHGGAIAFGPFLIFATLCALLFGDYLWNIFKGYLGLP